MTQGNADDALKAVMICLRCGYRQKMKKGAKDYTRKDKRHLSRCDFNMTIRYMNMKSGKIIDGDRRDHRCGSRPLPNKE